MSAIPSLVVELRAHVVRGTLTREVFLDVFERALRDLDDRRVDETEARARELRPLWPFGERVGCLRE